MTVHPIPTASLCIISYARLAKQDAEEVGVLRQAFSRDGFAYLDLHELDGSPGSVICGIDSMFSMGAGFFSTSLDEKMQYDVDAIGPYKLNGYKPVERNGGIAENKKDGVEGYLIPRDGICETGVSDKVDLPPAFQTQRDLIRDLVDQLHAIGLTMLRSLDNTNATTRANADCNRNKPTPLLTNQHRPGKASTSGLAVLRYPSLSVHTMHTGQGAHTDVGSLTILFCRERGLQVHDPTVDAWRFVAPRAGCAVINVGDSLRFMSGGTLRSALHRVIPYPGADIENRESCAYFMRPELDAEFVDDNGRRWTSLDWHMRKYKVYRSTASDQNKDEASTAILTGKPGFVGFWEG